MGTVSQLIELQNEYLSQINKLSINYQKMAIVRRTIPAIRSRLDSLDTYWKGCLTRHDEIIKLATADDKKELEYFKTDQFSVINEAAEEIRDFLNGALTELEAKAAVPLESRKDKHSVTDSNTGTISLPAINLKPFSGELTAWIDFRDMFLRMVDARKDFSGVQKLHYLKASLEGQAANALAATKVTEANYNTAWARLCKLYESPREIVYSYLDAILEYPKVGPNRSRDLTALRDKAAETYDAMLNLNRPINLWQDQYIHLIISKFDPETRREWERTQRDVTAFPKFSEIDEHLTEQIRVANSPGSSSQCIEKTKTPARQLRNTVRTHQANTAVIGCFGCDGNHPISQCQAFINKPVPKRIELVLSQGRCLNCYKPGHRPRECLSKNLCKICKRKHHTLVHLVKDNESKEKVSLSNVDSKTVNSTAETTSSAVQSYAHFVDISSDYTILPTASVMIKGNSGQVLLVRALFDQGSQSTFVAESVVRALNLECHDVSVKVDGMGDVPISVVKRATYISIGPCEQENPTIEMRALILSKLSGYLPPPTVFTKEYQHLASLKLADNDPTGREPILLLIGSDYYGSLLRDGLILGPPGSIIAQMTIFGWIISGPIHIAHGHGARVRTKHMTTEEELRVSIDKFWELEEVPRISLLSPEEIQCEKHFTLTHTRTPSGRYVVRLPFKTPTPLPIGNTSRSAKRLFLNQEMRLLKNPSLKTEYDNFLKEYLNLGHMQKVCLEEEEELKGVYLPHHPVFKATSSTTKTRVVFNASFRSDNNTSLNDFLHIGPKLQADLFAIVFRWRMHKYVYTADVEKMFRQILVDHEDLDFQRIFWRASPNDPIMTFRLNTVTYGTACAPFLANRVLKQLARDEGHSFPLAAPILESNVYVDDIMFGSDNVAELKQMKEQLTQLLTAGGFRVYKWAANHPDLLCDIPANDLALKRTKTFDDDTHLKVLGIFWEPKLDVFSFNVVKLPTAKSKRTFLSLLARIFDPLGWVAPVTIKAKILMQTFWIRKLGWDDPLPQDLVESCNNFQLQLPELSKIKIPRWAGQLKPTMGSEVHGFCDASNAAYSAVLYLKTPVSPSNNKISLLFSKTKVAPLKIQSVPRLELCAATLLARAIVYVTNAMQITQLPIFCWTDSSVVLFWLQAHPSKWKVFVANRVSEIQTLLPQATWRHVPTESNPADCASRGVNPSALLNHTLWWFGPAWLRETREAWPENKYTTVSNDTVKLEERKDTVSLTHTTNIQFDISERFSSWPKTIRITALILRYMHNLRNKENRITLPYITVSEMRSAITILCKITQRIHAPDLLSGPKHDTINAKSKYVQTLNLFIDKESVVRVGGRLRNSELPFRSKFPILLPPCRIAEIIIQHVHETALHGGQQLTLRLLRQDYWVIHARSLVKKCIYNCMKCARQRATVSYQRMGDLPAIRVTPSRPFSNTGIDYAGPFLLRSTKGRGQKTHKAYCVLFICLAVRAIHLECADDYTTAGFIAAFNRFVSRRGLPKTVMSDNGTNFIGAERELAQNFRRITQDPILLNHFSSDGIEWKFNPPAAPHFGGLWEAGVKSVKYHLKRIMGDFKPTFEEFSTLLCRIECVLNSRPLAPLNEDPDNFDALTPGHFLVGSLLKASPEPSVLHLKESHLSRWQTVQRLYESFWRIWSSDYLNTLQQRGKWQKSQPNIQEGDLVLLRHVSLPPSKWELGRIDKCFPGKDDLVRVVLVRTAKSIYKRPVTQIYKLPVDCSITKTKPQS